MNNSFKLDILKNMQFNEEDVFMMLQIQGLYEFKQLYEAAMLEIQTKLAILDSEFKVKMDHNPIHHVESRFKEPISIVNKLKRRNLEVSTQSAMDNLTDIAGIRVICNYISDIYFVEKILLQQDDIVLIRRSDYIVSPKENGYRSLHLVVEIPIFLSDQRVGVKVEIQIRTIAMDFWASLEHQLRYKKVSNDDKNLQQRLKQVSEKIHQLDHEMQSIYFDMKGLYENNDKM